MSENAFLGKYLLDWLLVTLLAAIKPELFLM